MLSDTEHRIREVEQALRLLQYNARVLTTRTDKVEFDVKTVRPAPAGDPATACSALVTFFVKCGSSTPLPGRTVTVTDGTTTYTGTTNSAGIVTFTLTVAGGWTGTVSKTGTTTVPFSFTFACSPMTVTITASGELTFTGNVQGCNFTGLGGVTVNVRQGTTVLATTTTDSSGNYSITLEYGSTSTLNVFATRSRFEGKTTTISSYPCNGNVGVSFTMDPALDYYCDPCGGAIPLYKTLNGTSSKGSFTLDYDTDLGYWTGTQVVTAYVNTDCQYIPPFGSPNSTCLPDTGSVTLFWEFGNLGGLNFRCYSCKVGVTVCAYVCPVDDSYRSGHPTEVTDTVIIGGIGCGGTHVNFPFLVSGSDTSTVDCGIPLGPDPVPLAGTVSLTE